MTDIVEDLRNYIKGELNIWDKEVYDEMFNAWPNSKEITLYRGINFKSKASYDNFIQKMVEDGAYIQNSASSFSSDYETALGFAITSKSYFLDRETMKASSIKDILGEKVSGYRGVVLEVKVPAHSVVDVNVSGEGIEDEYLFRPGEKINVKVHEIKSFYDLTQEDGFDVNKQLEKEFSKEMEAKKSILSNLFVNYLLNVHFDEITEENKTLLAQHDLSLELNRRRTLDISSMENENYKILSHSPYVTASYRKGFSYRGKSVDEINIQPLDFQDYEVRGLVNEDIKVILSKVAREALQVAMELHLEYRDNENVDIHYENLNRVYEYLTSQEKDLHKRMVGYKGKETYDNLNQNIKENFNGSKKRESIDKMTTFLNRLIKSFPSNETIKRERKERLDRIEKAKEDRLEMLGISLNFKANPKPKTAHEKALEEKKLKGTI